MGSGLAVNSLFYESESTSLCLPEGCLVNLSVLMLCPKQRSLLCIYWTAQKAAHWEGTRDNTSWKSLTVFQEFLLTLLTPTDKQLITNKHCQATSLCCFQFLWSFVLPLSDLLFSALLSYHTYIHTYTTHGSDIWKSTRFKIKTMS